MLTGVRIENFRAIGKPLELGFKKLNVLVGTNGSGKSSVLQALMLTAQSADADSSHLDLVPNGPRITLLRYPSEIDRLQFAHQARPMSVQVEFADSAAQPRVAYRWTRTRDDDRRRWEHEYRIDNERSWRSFFERGADAHWRQFDAYQEGSPRLFPANFERVPNARVLQQVLWNIVYNLPEAQREERKRQADDVVSQQERIDIGLQRLTYLTDLRGENLIEDTTGGGPRDVGTHGQDLRRLLVDVTSRSKPGFDLLREYAQKFGLDAIDAGTSGPQRVQVIYRDPASGTRLELQEAAAGAIAGLTILAELFLGPDKQTLLLEEPETHLHAQYLLHVADALVRGVAAGHQIIATSHSGLLLTAIGHLIRAQKIAADDVCVWHLDRNTESVSARPLTFAPQGFLREDIPSFLRVEQEMLRAWQNKKGFDSPGPQVHERDEGDAGRPRVEARPRGKRPSKPRKQH